MKTFDDLVFKAHHSFDCDAALIEFDNGYVASVLGNNKGGIGGFNGPYARAGEFEVAVMKKVGPDEYQLDYSTHITDDVLKFLRKDKLNKALKDIQSLPPIGATVH